MSKGRGWVLGATVAGAWLVTVGVAVGAGWMAADATLEPPAAEAPLAQPATYTVAEGMIERHFNYTASATWTSLPLAGNAASGTVTSVEIDAGEVVDAGDVLYTVDERPAVVAKGAVPMYRDLSAGASGADVAQLQAFLADQGYYDSAPSGSFSSGTTYAVRAWQRDLGVEDDGVVVRGDLVFAPKLPVRVLLADEITVGGQVSPSASGIARIGAAPRFSVTLSQDQVDLVPLDSAVFIEHDGGEWPARIASAESTAEGEVELVLAAAEDGAICGEKCIEAVPVGKTTHFSTRVVVIPETSGPLVPAAALRTDPSGAIAVVTPDGETHPVALVVRDSGQAIVDGVSAGTEILLFGGEEEGTPPTEGQPQESADTDPGAEVTES